MASGNALTLTPRRNGLTRVTPRSAPTLVRSRTSLVAAAMPMSLDLAGAMDIRRTRQLQQGMAWTFFRGIGACWYANAYKSWAIGQLSVYPAEIAGPRQKPIPVDDPYSLQQACLDDMARGPYGGDGSADNLEPILASATLQDSVAGEGYWYSRPDPNDESQNWHEILSVEELEAGGPTGWQIRRSPAAVPEPIEPGRGDRLSRMYTPDPRWKDLATSPMLVQHDTLEELWLRIQGGIANAKSRLATGKLLTIPTELDLDIPADDPEDSPTPFEKEFMRGAATAIKDPASAGRWFPLLLRGPAEFLGPNFIHSLDIYKDMPKDERDAITELRNRFAHDFDLPTELLTGLGDMTHWNAWIVDSMTWPHLRPIAKRVLANLTVCAYRPLLLAAKMDPEIVARQVLWYDESLVVTKPDRSAAATTGAGLGFVSSDAWLRANGFDPSDAPTEEDRARQFGHRWGDPGLASVGAPDGIWDKATGRIATRVTEEEKGKPGESVVEQVGGPQGPATGPPAPAPGPPTATPAPGAPSPAPPIPAASPPTIAASGNGNGHHRRLGDFATVASSAKRERLRKLGKKLGAIDRDLFARICTLADDRLHAAVRAVGKKLRSAAQGRPIGASLHNMDPLRIPPLLGPQQAHSLLGLNDQLAIDAGAASFAATAIPWLRNAQEAALRRIAEATDQDYEDIAAETEGQRDGWLTAAESALAAGFARMAGEYLYNPDLGLTGPGEIPDLMAPRDAIRTALQLAGGGDPGSGTPPLGIGTGPMAADALASGDAAVDGYTWVYNDIARTTFPGHLALDSIEFASWDDPQLAIQPDDSWLDVDFYAPGDHNGCSCTVEQTLIPVSELEGAEA